MPDTTDGLKLCMYIFSQFSLRVSKEFFALKLLRARSVFAICSFATPSWALVRLEH